MTERLHDKAFSMKAAASLKFDWFDSDADGAFSSALAVKSAVNERFEAFQRDANVARESALTGSRCGTDFPARVGWSSCRRGVEPADEARWDAEANQTLEPTPPAVTDRACARSAPAGGVAHL